MKKTLLILAIAIHAISHAAPVKTAVIDNGIWTAGLTWSSFGCPVDGDTVVIPAGKTVIINSTLNYSFLYIKVYGTLKMMGGKIKVDNTGAYIVYPGGKIKGSGSNAEQIRVGNDMIWDGTDPDITGPEKADVTTGGFVPFGNPLPVKFIGFTVTRDQKNVLVQWSTAEEMNVNFFELERSTDGKTWSTIAYMAASGNTNKVKDYSYTDHNFTAALGYYRIREVDMDGREMFTAIRTIRLETDLAPAVQIASVQNRVLLQFPVPVKGSVLVQFIGINGQLVGQQVISNPVGQVILDPGVRGNYIVRLSKGQEWNTARQILL